MRSIGDIQNVVQDHKARKKEAIQQVTQKLVKASKSSLDLGVKIVFLGFCSSLVVYMTVKAFMLAVQ